MKNTLSFLLVTLFVSQAFAIENCNFKTRDIGSNTFDFGDGAITRNYPEPIGDCDRFAIGSPKSCKDLAATQGYDCWQLEEWTTSQYDLGYGKRSSTSKKCFACVK